MIEGKTVLGLIPARAGSKGVPGKNVRLLAGRPLIHWTIDAAKASRYIDRLILSSDSAEIISVARQGGCEAPFIRPKELAADDTPGVDPVLHAIQEVPGFDYVVLLQPTSPLRSTSDIDNCLKMTQDHGAEFSISVTKSQESPRWMYYLDAARRLIPVLGDHPLVARRQDLPEVYVPNGAIYVANVDALQRSKTFVTPATVAFEMPSERSVDLDTEEDFLYLEYRLQSINSSGR